MNPTFKILLSRFGIREFFAIRTAAIFVFQVKLTAVNAVYASATPGLVEDVFLKDPATAAGWVAKKLDDAADDCPDQRF